MHARPHQYRRCRTCKRTGQFDLLRLIASHSPGDLDEDVTVGRLRYFDLFDANVPRPIEHGGLHCLLFDVGHRRIDLQVSSWWRLGKEEGQTEPNKAAISPLAGVDGPPA